jgi:gluconolactonase
VPLLLLLALLLAQDFTDLTVERVAQGLRFAEAPVWSPEGKLLYADVPNNQIWQWRPGEKPVLLASDTNGAGGLAFDAQGRLYVCEWHTRQLVRIDKKGKREVLAAVWDNKKLNGPNDLAIRHDGHIWFTDPAFGSAVDKRELDFYGIYHISPRGDLEAAVKWKTRPNGIALSGNGKSLYVTNADERKLYEFDIERNGGLANPRVILSGIEGVPGGIRLDEKGNLYLAARHVLIYSPSLQLLRRIELPESASNLAFGEVDLQSLFVTSHAQVMRIRVPVKGSLIYPAHATTN